MAEGLNRVTLIGNLGRDPDLKETAGGAVIKLRMAATEKYKDRNGELKESTEWVAVALWGKRAVALSRFLRKGSRVYVEGRLQTRSYEKDGQTRYATEVNARNLIMLDGRAEATATTQAPADGGWLKSTPAVDDGDIPF